MRLITRTLWGATPKAEGAGAPRAAAGGGRGYMEVAPG